MGAETLRERRKNRMATEQLNPEEQEQFKKWLEGKQARKAKATARRKAMNDLKKDHKEEYDKLVKKYS